MSARIVTDVIDGAERMWFPAVQYRNMRTGELLRFPPIDGSAYRIVIHSPTEYEYLRSSGLLTDARHTGRSGTLIDNRSRKG